MKCKYCDSEIPDGSLFCPNCGSPVESKAQTKTGYSYSYGTAGAQAQKDSQSSSGYDYTRPIDSKILSAVKDPLFLVICVAVSASAVAGLSTRGIPVIPVLLTIFLWIVYANGKKGIADAQGLRRVSGTVFAQYVIDWVVCGLVALAGIFSSSVLTILNQYDLYDLLNENLVFDMAARGQAFAVPATLGMGPGNVYSSPLDGLGIGGINGMEDLQTLLQASSGVILAILLFIAVVIAIFNVVGVRPIHKFIQSVYMSGLDGKMLIIKARQARIWLMVFGIFRGIGALANLASSSFVALLSSGGSAAALIIASLLIKKYFGEFENAR